MTVFLVALGLLCRTTVLASGSPGSVDASFDPGSGAGGAVNAVDFQSDGRIIIGGAFGIYNGTNQSRIARLNTNGSLDTSFNIGTGFSGGNVVFLKVLADDRIVVGGPFFTSFNGTNRYKAARLNSDGSLDVTYVADLTNNGSIVLTPLTVQKDGKLIEGFSDNSGTG